MIQYQILQIDDTLGVKGLRSLKKKQGINNIIFTIKSNGERKKRDKEIKLKQNKTKQNKKT